MAEIRTVGDLRKLLEGIPDDVEVALGDPNFGGAYSTWNGAVEIEYQSTPWPPEIPPTPRVLIHFPCVEPYED